MRRDVTGTKQYKLSAFGKDLNLQLTPSNDVVSPTLVVMRKISDTQWQKDLYTPEGQFYQGHVTSDPNSHVAVREMEGDEALVILHTSRCLYVCTGLASIQRKYASYRSMATSSRAFLQVFMNINHYLISHKQVKRSQPCRTNMSGFKS